MKLSKEIIDMINEVEIVPDGIYELEVDEVNAVISQNRQSYRVVVNFHISRGEYEGYEIKAVFTISHSYNLRAEHLSRILFRNLLLSAGITEDQINEKFDTDMLLGRRVMGYVLRNKQVGSYPDQNRVSRYMPIPVETEQEMD